MLRCISLFSGVGAYEKALTNLGIPFEIVAYSEIDKYASMSYSLIHGVPEELNLGDIARIDETKLPKDVDLITYSSPCTDFSRAGYRKGLIDKDGNKTQSGLFFDAVRIIKYCQPKYAISENVKDLVGKKFKGEFEIMLKTLDDAGYNNYWKVLNAKNYDIPQNRERVFVVSIRKDIDKGRFTFPGIKPLTKSLYDLLEDEKDVDERFIVPKEKFENMKCSKYNMNRKLLQDKHYATALMANDFRDPKCVEVRRHD